MVFNAVVAGMPPPTEKSSTGYRWAYNALHALALNLDNFVKSKGLPVPPQPPPGPEKSA